MAATPQLLLTEFWHFFTVNYLKYIKAVNPLSLTSLMLHPTLAEVNYELQLISEGTSSKSVTYFLLSSQPDFHLLLDLGPCQFSTFSFGSGVDFAEC